MNSTEQAAAGRVIPAKAPVRTVMRVAVATRRNERPRNEDAIGLAGWVLQGDTPSPLVLSLPIETNRPVVVALADGMGGHAAGDVAARIAAEHLTRSAPLSADELGAAFQRADEAIHAASALDVNLRGMACTAAVLLPTTGEALIANLGDVRVYRLADGYLGQVTVDDRPVTEPGETPTGTVLRWLGGLRRTVVQEHRHVQQLAPGDRLILCTDGLHDAVSLDTMRQCLHGDLRSVATNLVAAAGDHGDNVTVVVLELQGPDTVAPTASGVAHSVGVPERVASALQGVLAPRNPQA